MHRFMKWQAYVRDGARCRRCQAALAPDQALAVVVDRRLVPDLENVITCCQACAAQPARPQPPGFAAAPAPATESAVALLRPARTVPARGVAMTRRQLYARHNGRCGLCSCRLAIGTARVLSFHRGHSLGSELLLVCPDCRAGHEPPFTGDPVKVMAAVQESFARLTGVAPGQVGAVLGMILSLAVLTRYRQQAQQREYTYQGLHIRVREGTVVAVEPEPSWSIRQWPGVRGLRREAVARRQEPRLDLMSVRLPGELLDRLQRQIADKWPGWSFEMWLVHTLRQVLQSDPAPEMKS